MNAQQEAAFLAGAGVPATTVLTAIATLVLTIAFVWALWITWGSFRAWAAAQLSLMDLAWTALRTAIVLMVLGYYVR
ncbi:MAG TPA: TIGR03758 family integrating conjugative element protein [Woeseiaceae bacterium]|nr:TIGR03758 family integrating conjugative element protein [Woeseiaceae bacterium]